MRGFINTIRRAGHKSSDLYLSVFPFAALGEGVTYMYDKHKEHQANPWIYVGHVVLWPVSMCMNLFTLYRLHVVGDEKVSYECKVRVTAKEKD